MSKFFSSANLSFLFQISLKGVICLNVYEILFPANEEYQGMVHLAVLNKNKEMKSLGSYLPKDLPDRIETLKIMKSMNYYITANSTYTYTKRRLTNLFSLNNIVLDFDIHGRMNQHLRNELIDEFVWRIKRDLFFIKGSFKLPLPNILHKTGRGIQMWWHINSASKQLQFIYHEIIENLAIIFKDFLSEYPELEKHIEIDVSASKNSVGLFRLFDTYNTHTGTKTEIEILHEKGFDINQLNQSLRNHPVAIENCIPQKDKPHKKKQNVCKAENKYFNSNEQNVTKGRRIQYQRGYYDALHRKRLAFIKWWSLELDDIIGKRDLLLYYGYNAAKEIMSTPEAEKWCNHLNDSFEEPLDSIEYIFKEIQNPFHIRSNVFFEKLGASEEDIKRFEKEYSKHSVNLTRNMEIQKRKKLKDKQKEIARELLKIGESYKTISEKVGLSTSTIYRLAKEIGNKKTEQKPWEILGISRATYYRRKKL